MSDLSNPPIPEFERGWTPQRKAQFVEHLSQRGNVRAACKRVGLSREAAYRLRRRDPLFARGWAAAMALAHAAGIEVLGDRAIDGIEEDVWYRGELVGTRRKYDTRLLLAHLGRLDQQAGDKAAAKDAARFDELVACLGGERVPDDMCSEDEFLPLSREESARELAAEVEDALRQSAIARTGTELDEEACTRAFRGGHAKGQARWDLWFDNACGYVDYLAERDGSDEFDEFEEEAEFSPRTVSDVSTAAIAAALAAGSGNAAGEDTASP